MRLLTLILLALAACSGETPPPAESATGGDNLPAVVLRNRLHGVFVGRPQPKPDFVLTTATGERFDLRRDTEGYLTLLFFGYTHCPDVCPIHMATLGKVLDNLPEEVTSRVRVVFVTTDPARDTPERIRAWLGNFHASFIGLTGTDDEIRIAQEAAGLQPAYREPGDSARPDLYYIAHAAQVMAFTSDNLGHVIYPSGIQQADWANDLPILVNGWPE